MKQVAFASVDKELTNVIQYDIYLTPSGCVMMMSRSPLEVFPRLYDPPQTTIAFKNEKD